MNINALKDVVAKARVIPVLVLDDISVARPLAQALVSGGLNVLEVTLRTPNAQRIMSEMAKVEGAIVGSGTVRSFEQMQQSVDAGCQFMVSPGASQKLLGAARDVDIPLLPGVASPSEAMAAAEMGYSFLKFFPAEAMGGADVLKSFASPFPDLVFCPTGGISPLNAPNYLGLKNVICVGGSWVTPRDLIEQKDFAAIEELARQATLLGH